VTPRVRVFVYGTLRQGHANHRVLVELDASRVGSSSPAVTARARTLVDLGPYPALLPEDATRDAERGVVEGEIYEIAEEALEALDVFEGCPDLYTRESIVLEHDGASIEAWTYVLATPLPAHAEVVATGRYAGGGVVLENGARDREDAVSVTRKR
jgi:gamma-glutamylcyclotransferase (GGCT)/AIG2-like uncharacterized protein YtfP